MQTKNNTGRYGISCEDSFRFRSAAAAERARKQAVSSLRKAAARNPEQFAMQLARYETATVRERTIVG
jgi:hypothetical protein